MVRASRFAWFEIVGNEKKAVALRSSLAVEKYRVRVLIDAVNYKRLKDLDIKYVDTSQILLKHN
jgi:Fe-S cluster assembly iron-binding protein IscA